MIIVTGHVRLKDGARDQLVAAAREMCQLSRAEDGCHAYRFGFDLEDDQVVHIHEEWESEQALEKHLAEPHFVEFGRQLGGMLESGGDFTKWVGAKATTLF